MKRCPKCNADYFDNMLEYCLEDGAKLYVASGARVAADTREQTSAVGAAGPLAPPTSEPTVVISNAQNEKTDIAVGRDANTSFGIALTPLIVALAHNWWQWVYLEKQYVYSITDYLLSANFILWLLLLIGGALSGFYVFRNYRDRTYALIGLVVLAINLILFLVPRR